MGEVDSIFEFMGEGVGGARGWIWGYRGRVRGIGDYMGRFKI